MKTDNIDAEKLVNLLRRFLGGEQAALRPVTVPTIEQEDARRPLRHLERLKDERTSIINRIKALLATQGVTGFNVRSSKNLHKHKQAIATHERLPGNLKIELTHDMARVEVINTQIEQVERHIEAHAAGTSSQAQKVQLLAKLRGLGTLGASILVQEFFGWRNFKNRRQVGGAAGLGGTPYDSGQDRREQGISKAGNTRVRKLMVQLAWTWLRLQPNSADSVWFIHRFSTGKRVKKVGIVALARRLLVALWRYVDHGVVPAGAVLKEA